MKKLPFTYSILKYQHLSGQNLNVGLVGYTSETQDFLFFFQEETYILKDLWPRSFNEQKYLSDLSSLRNFITSIWGEPKDKTLNELLSLTPKSPLFIWSDIFFGSGGLRHQFSDLMQNYVITHEPTPSNRSSSSFLPQYQIKEILKTKYPNKYLVAASYSQKTDSVTVIRADLSSLTIPSSWFKIATESFEDIEIVDWGQGLRLGPCEVSARSILLDFASEK